MSGNDNARCRRAASTQPGRRWDVPHGIAPGALRTGLFVELWTRDEHCPPHIHVENEAAPWEAQLEFSFLTGAVRLMDIDPIAGAPAARTIDRIKAAIAAKLPRCRSEWWTRIGTRCLDNRWIRIAHDGGITMLAGREKGATQIAATGYNPETEHVTSRTKAWNQWTTKPDTAMETWSP